ncbi:tyrosine-type recombinase/integrase [soil metagenome]
MSPLRQQMQNDMILHGLAERTQDAYLSAVIAIAKHFHRSPDQLSSDDIKAYLLHLINERHLSGSTTNQAGCALRFLFRVTLKQGDVNIEIPLRKIPSKLPQLLSREEVQDILRACTNLRHRTLLTTAYATGLRISELCQLKVNDIDSKRMMLRVVNGKGGKDRYTLLSPALLANLRLYWQAYQPKDWLFPNGDGAKPISQSQILRFFYAAKRRANIHKQGGVHSLRHAFATHLLESGVDLHSISRLMGHDHISTTARYLHMQDKIVVNNSPLDLLSNLRLF